MVGTADAAGPAAVEGGTVIYQFPDPDISSRWEIAEVDSLLEVVAVLRNTGSSSVRVGFWNVLHMQANNGGSMRIGTDTGNAHSTGPVHFDEEREHFELRFEAQQTPYVSQKGWMPYTSESEWLAFAEKQRRLGDTRVYE